MGGFVLKRELKEGQRVLIHGASGGVGQIRCSLAKWKGFGSYWKQHISKNQTFLKKLRCSQAIETTQAQKF